MKRWMRAAIVFGLALPIAHAALSAPTASAKKANQAEPAPARFIVKFRDTSGKDLPKANASHRIAALARQSGMSMRLARPLSGGAHLVSMNRSMAPDKLTVLAERISKQPGIEYAEPDRWIYPRVAPNDPLYPHQYYLHRIALNAPAAWNVTTGSEATVVAVLDSGIRPEHIDIAGRLVRGYDFVSADPGGGFASAVDGNGRDANPEDPGDACIQLDEPSFWHGTRVASLIGAVTNDGQGMAGVDWQTRILPVRVLGRCGGFLSDIIDGLRWAAGLPVPGVPDNPNPARILNYSLGGSGPCSPADQHAINDVAAAGVLVVVAVANEPVNALRGTPENCQNVLTVAATNRDGGLANFSAYGPKVGVSAPGVEILTAANRGIKAPIPNGDTHTRISGTSFAAPLVSGVAALMLSLNPALTLQQLIGTLRANAGAFVVPSVGTPCDARVCGAGLLNAAAAVQAVANGQIVSAVDGGNGLRAVLRAASPLPLNSTRTGALTKPFQFDVYKLVLPPQRALTLETSGPVDTYGYLFNVQGRLVAQNDDLDPRTGVNDPHVNRNFRIKAELPQGTYFVAVEGFDRETRGTYTLKVNAPSAARPPTLAKTSCLPCLRSVSD
jgi:serine protease